MKAMVIHKHGEIEDLTYETAWPDPIPGEGEVLLQVKACTLNYHDLFTLRGMPGIKVPMPIIMGLDTAGVIAEIGPDVEGWSVGDRVVIDPIDRVAGKLQGEMMDGGLAELMKVTAQQLIKLPDAVSFAQAAALPCAYGTAYRTMISRGAIQKGETVLILGASGGVGTCCVQLAKLAGAHVIAAASTDEKIQQLLDLGADECINYTELDFKEEIHARFGKPRMMGDGGGVDMVVNFTGGDTWLPSLKCLKHGGRLVTCGATAGYDPTEDIRFIWTFELNILGANGWNNKDIYALLDLVQQGKLDPSVHKTVSLQDAREAFRLLDERKVFGKIAITP